MKRILCLLLIALLVISSVFAGGSKEASDNSEAGQSKPLRFAIKASEAGRAENLRLVELAKENGIDVELVTYPDPGAGEADKLLISLMAGDEFDLVLSAHSNMNPFYDAGVMTCLDDLAADAGYDIAAVFGDYPAQFDGKYYGLPAFVDIAITIYNKDLFDRAGIPYPESEDWTWEKFIEVGQKISALGDDIYGAFNPLWAHYNYMLAMQKGASHYKEDGTSNYDDPLFKEALEFYYDLGNKYHVNPEYLVQESRQMPLEYFTSGNVGMSVAGGWTSVWLTDMEKYPRTWKAGVLPMPYPEGYPKSTSVVVSSFWVPETSTQKELAFKCAALFAENMYKMGSGRIPARVDLTQEEIDRCSKDANAELQMAPQPYEISKKRASKRKYTPFIKRQDRPDAIAWLLKFHPDMPDSVIASLLATTKTTVLAIRNRTHARMSELQPRDPVLLGFCSQVELDKAVAKLKQREEQD